MTPETYTFLWRSSMILWLAYIAIRVNAIAKIEEAAARRAGGEGK